MAIFNGTEGRDTLRGGVGNDEIYGNEGRDKLYGEGGNDLLSGGADRDRLYGGDDNDTLDGGSGNDRLYGGDGDDKYIFEQGDERDSITDDDGQESLYFRSLVGLEHFHFDRFDNNDVRITIGSDTVTIGASSYSNGRYSILYGAGDVAFGKLFLGSDSAETIDASIEKDLIQGGRGDDTLNGGDGDDIYVFGAGDGNDVISDTQGNNAIYFKSSEAGSYSELDDRNFAKDGNNLVITINVGGNEQTVTVNDFYLDTTNFVIHYNTDVESKFFAVSQGALTPVLSLTGDLDDNDLAGDEGNDFLYGLGGDDILEGGNGNDTLDGGEGWDEIYGEDGNDILDGGLGEDILEGGAGDDIYRFSKGDGVDEIYDNQGTNRIEFLSSSDGRFTSLVSPHFMRAGNDLVILLASGSEEQQVRIEDYYETEVVFEIYYNLATDATLIRVTDDIISGATVGVIEDQSVTLTGGDGNDVLTGLARDDVISGEGGNDILSGAQGVDTISGGEGDDTIDGGRGDDLLDGGEGNDDYIFERSDGTDTITDTAGTVNLYFKDATADSLLLTSRRSASLYNLQIIDRYLGSDVVNIEYGSYENGRYSAFYGAEDTLLGLLYASVLGNSRNNLVGSDGKDFMVGAGSNGDRIMGGGGDDRIYGSDSSYRSNDQLFGGEGNDVIYGRAGDDSLYGGAGSNQLYGGDGSDTIYAGAGNDLIDGGNNRISSGVVFGDTLSYDESFEKVTVNLATGRGSGGYAEGDIIRNIENIEGSIHDDTLIGDAGNNEITGGYGNDSLQGGEGDDTYHFSAGEGNDVIADAQGDNKVLFASVRSRADFTFSKSEDGTDLIIDAEADVYYQKVTIEDYYLLPDDASFSIYYYSIRSTYLINSDEIPA